MCFGPHGSCVLSHKRFRPFPKRRQNHGQNQQRTQSNRRSLRVIFNAMDAHKAQEIRDAYYNAVEGLRTLADALEIADAEQKESAGPLLVEHLYAIEAIDAMKRSRLGAISKPSNNGMPRTPRTDARRSLHRFIATFVHSRIVCSQFDRVHNMRNKTRHLRTSGTVEYAEKHRKTFSELARLGLSSIDPHGSCVTASNGISIPQPTRRT